MSEKTRKLIVRIISIVLAALMVAGCMSVLLNFFNVNRF